MLEKITQLANENKNISDFHLRGGSDIAYRALGDIIIEPDSKITDENLPLKIKLRRVQWSRTKCCWPEGDPKQNNFKFCGQDIFPGRPYCDKHSLLAYTNARENS